MSRRAGAAAALVLAVLGGIIGCSNPTPASDTLPSTPATATTTSAATLPPLGPADFPVPDDARQQTADGAAAFTEYYIELVNRLTGVDSITAFRQLSRDCEVCDQYADGATDDLSAGYHYDGGQLTIRSAAAPQLDGPSAGVAFLLDQTAYRVLDSQNSVIPGRAAPELTLSGGVALSWDRSAQSWVVTTLTAEPT